MRGSKARSATRLALAAGVGVAGMLLLLPVRGRRSHVAGAGPSGGWATTFHETFRREPGARWTAVDAGDEDDVMTGREHEVFLPLVLRNAVPEARPRNLLRNGGFEADWTYDGGIHRAAVYREDGRAHEENRDGIETPPGWLTWFRYTPRTWEEPGVQGVSAAEEPRRVHGGPGALRISVNYRTYDAGLLQQVDVEPGTQVSVSAWAHAWSNRHDGPHTDDPLWSEGPGLECGFQLEGEASDDDWRNFTFWVGIDPTGGVDPQADAVEWGVGAHIYNCFHQVPPVEVEAQSRRVTVFLRTRTLWPFKHNHAYWDQVVLTGTDEDGGEPGWLYPMIDRGGRIGVHSIVANEVRAFSEDLVAGGTRFPVVKAVDNPGWLAGIKESSPETITLARVHDRELEACPEVEDPNTDLDEMANGLLSFILNELTKDARMRGVVEYWEVANEPDPPGTEGYRRLAELMIKCMEKAERYGLKLALFSLNAGTPEWDQMEAMVETGVFARAQEGGHILALHEGTFETHDPKDGWGGLIPGAPEGVDGAGSMNFRYRYLYHLLEQRDEVIPLVVSEWYCGDEAAASTETLVDALRWYDGEASRDYYFWATCPFTLGPTQGWEHTDYERVYPGLVEYMIEVRDRENGLSVQPSLRGMSLGSVGRRQGAR